VRKLNGNIVICFASAKRRLSRHLPRVTPRLPSSSTRCSVHRAVRSQGSNLRGNKRRLLAGEVREGRDRHTCNKRTHHFAAQSKLLLKNLHAELFSVCDDPLILGVAGLQVQAAAFNVGADNAGIEARAAKLCGEHHHVKNVTVATKLATLRARTLCCLRPVFRCLSHHA
jgi:hypothetical protein